MSLQGDPVTGRDEPLDPPLSVHLLYRRAYARREDLPIPTVGDRLLKGEDS